MIQAPCTISRLKGFFRSGINYSCYQDMLNISKRKASGSLPKDIISLLISNNIDKKSAIQETEKLFSDVVDILGKVDKLEMQAINRVPFSECFSQMSHLFMGGDVKGLYRPDSIYKKKKLETVIQAEKFLLSRIKKYIPETSVVIITPLGGGKFGNGYKLRAMGQDGQPIFEDKALKVYRGDYFWKSFQGRCKRYMGNSTDEKLVEQFNKEREIYKRRGINLPAKTAQEIRKKATDNLELIEKIETKSTHGAMAEANISEFLRFFSGHFVKSKEGISIPSFFGLGNTKFSLGEFIDNGKKAEKKFLFERLFVQNKDIEETPDNVINGICVDLGGFIPLVSTKQGKEILSSKQNMRIIKSLYNSPKEKRKSILEECKKSEILPNEVIIKIEQILLF